MTREHLRKLVLGHLPMSGEGTAPLFVQAKKAQLLAMIEAYDLANQRELGRIEGAIWSLGHYSFQEMEEE